MSYCEGRARTGGFPGVRLFGRGREYLFSERTSGENSWRMSVLDKNYTPMTMDFEQ
jgi:hypothetical protein